MLWKKLSILKAAGDLPKCLSQSSRLSAGGDAGESTGKCCTAHGLVPQLPAPFQYSGWLSPGCMHVKSGLWQLWKVIICSKGYTQDCCFHQYPRHTWFMARHILQQRTIMINNFLGTPLSNYFPNWLQWAATRSGGQQFCTFWVANAHCLNYQSILTFPTLLLSSLHFPPLAWLTSWDPSLYHELLRQNSNTMLSLALLHHHTGQPGPLLPCFPTTHRKDLAPYSLSSPEHSSAVGFWASSWGGSTENTAVPNLASVYAHTGVTGQRPCTSHAVLFDVVWCSGILWLAVISPEAQYGN